jgi:hypothetical protein
MAVMLPGETDQRGQFVSPQPEDPIHIECPGTDAGQAHSATKMHAAWVTPGSSELKYSAGRRRRAGALPPPAPIISTASTHLENYLTMAAGDGHTISTFLMAGPTGQR